ncbi:MAG: caspase domain-containing protein [Burkholderiales bacterium]
MRFLAVLLACCLIAVPHAAAERVQQLAAAKPAPGGERRVALVIGNSAYKHSPLKNPVNDARAMAQALVETGFSVTLLEDGSETSMRRAIRAFGDELLRGGAGLFYYAGHGMQVRGRNYLIPVNADIQREDEVEDQAVDANFVLTKMDTAKNALNIMILDACRNNPFHRSFRSAAQGLAQMEAPSGTLIAFATAPGSVAADGDGDNGVYTKHLLQQVRQPGVPVEQLFKQVRNGVMNDTKERQVPWESSSLRGDFYFMAPVAGAAQLSRDDVRKAVIDATREQEQRSAKERAQLQSAMEKMIQEALAKQRAELEAQRGAPAPAAAAPPVVAAVAPGTHERQVELAFWDSIKDSANPADFTAYLQRYPQGAFAPIARNRLAVAPAAAAPKPAAAPAQVASIAPSPPPAAAVAPAPASGTRWQYSGFDVDNRDKKLDLLLELQGRTGAGVLEVLHTNGGTSTPWVYTSAPTLVGHAGGWAMFSPLVGGEPLEVGKTWSAVDVVRIDSCGRGIVQCSAEARVAARENVTVKAGTFEALKVVVDVIYTANNNSASREIVFWHVPGVQRPVKYRSRTQGGHGRFLPMTDPNADFELVGFQLEGRAAVGSLDLMLAGSALQSAGGAPVVVASAVGSSATAALSGPAIPRVGDRWEYRRRDINTDRSSSAVLEVSRVAANAILESIQIDGGVELQVQHASGNYLSSSGLLQFSPYLRAFIPGDAGGDLGDVQLRAVSPCASPHIQCSGNARVAGRERVTVPAGTFDATRVEVSVQAVNRGSMVSAGFSGGIESTITAWYADAVRRVVKYEVRGNILLLDPQVTELVSFKLK